MIIDWAKIKIFIKPGYTDMRKQINGLSVIVQEELKLNPFSGSLFIFCNKRKRIMKLIYWDRNGFCLWLKRLEKDKFPWPKDEKETMEITEKEFKFILDGIDFFHVHKKIEYEKVF